MSSAMVARVQTQFSQRRINSSFSDVKSCNINCLFTALVSSFKPFCEKLSQHFKTVCDQHNHKEFILISKSRRWTIQYANGFFNVVEWKSFVHIHKLSTYHTLVLNSNVHVELHTMVLDANNASTLGIYIIVHVVYDYIICKYCELLSDEHLYKK